MRLRSAFHILQSDALRFLDELEHEEEGNQCEEGEQAIHQANVDAKQNRQRLLAGSSWDNVYDMVFTRDNGMFIRFKTLYVHFKALVSRLNRPEVRFHDIRHTYATLAIQSEIDFKTLSLSLGHATVAFTLDTYGHVSNHMSQNAAAKMEKFICSL